MTSTTDRRPPPRTGPPSRPTRTGPRPSRGTTGGVRSRAGGTGSPLPAGLTAAAWALGAGLVALALPVLLVWATDSRSGSGAVAALRAVAQVWLLANGDHLHVPGGVLGLTPLGLTALPLALLWRGGRHAALTVGTGDLAAVGTLTAAITVPYAVGTAVVAAAASTAQLRPAPVHALLAGAVVAALGAGAGVLRQSGITAQLVDRLPPRVRGLSVGTAAAVVLLVGVGALVAGASLAVHVHRAGVLARSSHPGVVGGVALLLVGLLLVPNAALWAAAWLAGPGFAVGVGTTVGPLGTAVGPLPALPLLAALPASAPPTWLGMCALAIPALAGAAAGAVVAPRLAVGWLRAAGEAALLGPCAAVAVGVLAAVSGGPLGGGRLRAVGPSPWRVGLAAGLGIAVGAALTTALLVALRGRRTHPDDVANG